MAGIPLNAGSMGAESASQAHQINETRADGDTVMKISTMHTEGGPMIGVGSSWMNTTAAQKLAGDIYRAVIDAHRTESTAYRHDMTPGYLEYPTFDESKDFEPVSLGDSHD